MIFKDFVLCLYTALNEELPGLSAHAKMAPGKRPSASTIYKQGISPKQSAVLILFYPVDNKPHFCLIQRPSYVGVHSGQISFPGGKMDDVDQHLKDTALRETWEEIGVLKEDVKILSHLTEVYIPPSNFLVTPFIGFCEELPDFKLDSREVKELFSVPNTVLMNENNVKRKSMSFTQSTKPVKIPYYDINNKIVCGATAVILSEVKEILKTFY